MFLSTTWDLHVYISTWIIDVIHILIQDLAIGYVGIFIFAALCIGHVFAHALLRKRLRLLQIWSADIATDQILNHDVYISETFYDESNHNRSARHKRSRPMGARPSRLWRFFCSRIPPCCTPSWNLRHIGHLSFKIWRTLWTSEKKSSLGQFFTT